MLKQLFLSVCLLFFATFTFADTTTHQQLQKIFQQGLTAFEKGDYQSAAAYFRLMLKDHPNLLRARLELAQTLYESGDYESAKYHFEQVLSATLPSNVRANINHFLTLIREQLPSFRLSLNLSLDNKIPAKTRESSFGPFIFNNTGIRQHTYNLIVDGKIPINAKDKTFSKLRLEHSDSNGSKNAITYLKATIGKHYPLGNGVTLTPEIGFHHLIYQDHQLYNGKIFGLQYFKPIGNSNYLDLGYNYRQLNYVDAFRTSKGAENELTFSFIKLPSISSRLDAQLVLLKYNAQDESKTFNRIGLNLFYNRDVSNAWNVGFNLKTNRTYYQQASGFLGNTTKKKDRQRNFEISLLNRLWEINGIAPKLYIGKTVNSSNIDIYEKSDPYITLGFTQQF